jgi:ubiquitin C-terminal hydrolase
VYYSFQPTEQHDLRTSSRTTTAASAAASAVPLPPGLANSHNACFVNALLQALASSEACVAYLRTTARQCLRDQATASGHEHPVTVMLCDALELLVTASNRTLDFRHVERKLRSLSSSFDDTSQQDAEELLVAILDAVEKEAKLASAPMSGGGQLIRDLLDGEKSARTPETKVDPWWRLAAASSPSSSSSPGPLMSPSNPTLPPFHGTMLGQITCSRCGRQSPLSTSQFTVLNMPIAHSTLPGCFHEFCKSETIDQVECPKCALALGSSGVRQPARKRLMFSRFPKVLCIRLQRNRYDVSRGFSYKDDTRLELAEELDLSDFTFFNVLAMEDCMVNETLSMLNGKVPNTMDPPSYMQSPFKRSPVARRAKLGGTTSAIRGGEHDDHHQFHLVALIEHVGGASGGHFVTYRKFMGEWIRCSDESVSQVSVDQVGSACAFLYVYASSSV